MDRLAINDLPNSFTPIGDQTAEAFRKIGDRGGINSGDKTLSRSNAEERVTSFYNNEKTLLIIPRGESEPEGFSAIRLRDAVIIDIPQIMKEEEHVLRHNSQMVRSVSEARFRENSGENYVNIPFGLSDDGQLLGGSESENRQQIGVILTVDQLSNVRSVNFVYPDGYSEAEMEKRVAKPYNYQLKAMASMMQHNLRMAKEKKQEINVLPSFIMSNSKFKGSFENEQKDKGEKTIIRTLWNAVKAQNKDLLTN